ncbi:MAG TPA: response regulator [Verrucomicrobiae bacterium]|jgi:PAS domain S-box-containing protein|nr:response regulator [Verrucomicrobiae bacterium]
MTDPQSDLPPRILVVDDNPSIHEDFRKILGAKSAAQSHLENVETALFGDGDVSVDRHGFRIDSAYQGQEAFELVKKSVAAGDPYAVAFVDVRMPPGWDGIETLEKIWNCAPEVQAVVCTAFSDYSWDEMTQRLGQSDNLLILKKPFETVEVLQMVHALSQKWRLGRQAKLRMDDLDRMVRQRTAELHASEERFSKAFQASPIPLVIFRCDDGGIIDSNASFSALTGFSPDALLKKSTADLQLESSVSDLLPLTSPDTRLREKSCALRRGDGSSRQVVLSTEPLSLGSVPCMLAIVEDITEQLKIEAQLRQAQKMEVIGRMAAGIAHEFNNLLTVIQGDVGLLQSANPNTIDRQALLDQIMQASQRAATFTRQLLAFSRKQVLQPRVLNVCDLISRMKKMLGRLIGEKFDVQVRSEGDAVSVCADEGGLEQVLMNLVLNARDAMPEGGIVEISAAVVTLDESAVAKNSEARAGDFVRLQVTDHGSGMSPQILSRIFDPFFTTKDIGKGTGLGLSTIHGIVKQHEGWVEVISEVGKGSTFKVFLPSCNSLPARAVVAPKPAAPEAGKGETILVVEDDVAVRELACMALRKQGYRLIQAAHGPEAIEVWKKSPGQVDLLLTDMVMPNGMSGGELAKDLMTRNPKLKIIYTSGYSPEILKQDSILAQGINFLPKPYDLPALLKAVRLCLDGGKLPQYEVRAGQTTQTTTTV